MALSRFEGLSGYKFMGNSAVHFEIGGLTIFLLNHPGRLLEGKDSDYWGGHFVALGTLPRAKRQRIYGYLGGSFRDRWVNIVSGELSGTFALGQSKGVLGGDAVALSRFQGRSEERFMVTPAGRIFSC